MNHWAHDSGRKVDILGGCFLIVRRSALNDVGLLDQGFFMYAEDIDWCKRFHEAGWDVVFHPEARAIHYGGASSSNAPARFFLEMLKARKRYWRKHHNRWNRILFTLLNVLELALRVLVYTPILFLMPRWRQEAKHKIVRSLRGIVCLAQVWNCD
jgi:GT2 family glycosyltransferase